MPSRSLKKTNNYILYRRVFVFEWLGVVFSGSQKKLVLKGPFNKAV